MFPRTFIITFHSTQVQPQFLNTVENWFLNPLTAHEICAVKILKELLLGLSGGKILKSTLKKNKIKITRGTNICYLYNEVR